MSSSEAHSPGARPEHDGFQGAIHPEGTAWAGDEESGLAGEQVSVERAGSGVGEISWAALQLLTTSWILSEVLSRSFEPEDGIFQARGLEWGAIAFSLGSIKDVSRMSGSR